MKASTSLLIVVSSTALAALATGPSAGASSQGDELYQYDDGTAEGELGLAVIGGVCWIHVFEAQPGGEIITSISTALGAPGGFDHSPLLGEPLSVHIWDDPNNDGNPTDAVLLGGGVGEVTEVDNNVFMEIALDAPVEISGTFVIGASVFQSIPNVGPSPGDLSQASEGRAWAVGVFGAPFDPENINGDTGVAEMDTIGRPAVWLLRANASACPADLDGSGAVDFGDVLAVLAAWGNKGGPEDLDESGFVDFADLLIVLAAWGACP